MVVDLIRRGRVYAKIALAREEITGVEEEAQPSGEEITAECYFI